MLQASENLNISEQVHDFPITQVKAVIFSHTADLASGMQLFVWSITMGHTEHLSQQLQRWLSLDFLHCGPHKMKLNDSRDLF